MAEDIFKNTITLADAARMTGPLAFNIMIKPGGSLCNLDCRYCYYLDKAFLYGGREPRMTEDMLEKLIRNYIESCDVPEVTFNWHGGEPLIMGLDFYRKAVEFEKKYADGKIVHNTLQTNGTLVTPKWADFFASNRFLIGISIDGPEHIHDRYRSSKAGEPSFSKVMAGLRNLVYGGVEFNTLTALSKASEGHGLEVYQFLKSIGSRYMQFLPVVEKVAYRKNASGKAIKSERPSIVNPGAEENDGIGTWSISDIGYGKFLCEIFDWWVRNDVGKYFVGIFDATLACLCGAMPGTCVFGETCGGNIVVEHNGDVYVCDHFVYPEYKLGNIAVDNLRDLAGSQEALAFGIEKRNTLPSQCRRCEWVKLCNGECPKHRFAKTKTGEKGLNSLCAGLQLFYRHTYPYMLKMRELLEQKRAPAEIMFMDI
ncbi:MAG: anaerobic sulfatase maturase [Candidatus Cryptobacteroides sp.]